ncbi:MAG: DUF6168 family protein [Aestuariibaculum sp.]
MIKRILIFSISILVLFVVTFTIHNQLSTVPISFKLLNVYVFHAIASIIVYASVELVSEKIPNQAGYAYLMLICFKIGAFVILFNPVFVQDSLSQAEKLGLIVPLFLFLTAEAIGVSKLLNSK